MPGGVSWLISLGEGLILDIGVFSGGGWCGFDSGVKAGRG
jgi:hypothetical protein